MQGDGYYHHDNEAAFEDGTLDYLNLPAVEAGIKHVERVGIDTIHERVMALTDWLLQSLANLHHSNGRPLVRILGPADTHMRGGTISPTSSTRSADEIGQEDCGQCRVIHENT